MYLITYYNYTDLDTVIFASIKNEDLNQSNS